ncbi:MAG TPA: hypothetical protein VGO31_00285 [Microbacteriaceae bacterium]|jgi:hypothetical protein|nr:hypothetical protein [Microbacteriaceae bacterium]
MLDLNTLTDELHRLAASKREPTPLSPDALAACKAFCGLSRYRDGSAGLRRLFSDLESGIDSIFADDDRRIALAHFRLEHGDLQYMARHRALIAPEKDDTTRTRRRAENTIEPKLAFHLFQRGIEWEEPYAKLDYGFRGIEHDWTIKVDPSDRRIETLTQKVVARAARPGQRFYVFSSDLVGARPGSVRVVSDDPDHVLVGEDGTVPLERSVPNGESLIVVYLGKDYDTNQKVETGIESVSTMEAMPRDSGIFAGTAYPVESLRLTADVPLGLAPVMTFIDRSPHAWGVDTPKEVRRTDGSPVVYKVKPKLGRQYEIAWLYNA